MLVVFRVIMIRRIINKQFTKNIHKVVSSGFHSTIANGYSHKVDKHKVSVADFYTGKSVFITGGTGFLGKVLIEKLLRSCVGIDTIYILIRDKNGMNVNDRLHQIADNELFHKIHSTNPNALSKLVPIAGDITLPHLGINPEDEALLTEKVSVVFHSAATVELTEPLETAFNINVEGTRKVMDLCHRLKNIDCFVHISTVYAFCNRDVIFEEIYPPPMSLDKVQKLVQKNHSIDELEPYFNGLPNTYTFTKAIAESYVVENHEKVPTVILRPSSVISVARDPLPGWLESWQAITLLPYQCAKGYTKFLHGDKNNIIDLIPVDYCANLAIVSASRCVKSKEVSVYNSCSSSVNPILYGFLLTTVNYTIGTNKTNTNFMFFKSELLVKIFSIIFQTTPAYVADCWLFLTGRSVKNVKNITRAGKYRDSLKFFLDRSWVIHSRNTSALHDSLSSTDRDLFPLNSADIEWKPYLEQFGRGIRKYLVQKKSAQKK